MRKKNENKVVHQIVMVRHGQYNRKGGDDAKHTLTAVGRQQAEATGKRLDALLKSGEIYPVKTMYFSTMTRATETCQLILPEISRNSPELVLASSASAVGVGSASSVPAITAPSSAKPMRVEACSMIREGAVCPPSPPSAGWEPTEEEFEKEGARVRQILKIISLLLKILHS